LSELSYWGHMGWLAFLAKRDYVTFG